MNRKFTANLLFVSSFIVLSCSLLTSQSNAEIQAQVDMTMTAIHERVNSPRINSIPIATFTRVPIIDEHVNPVPPEESDPPESTSPIPTTPVPVEIPDCPGSLPTRVRLGIRIQVTTSGKVPKLGIRPEPTLDAQKMFELPSGEQMSVLDGPVCADNSYFWYISSSKGDGWVREGNQEFYFVDPLP